MFFTIKNISFINFFIAFIAIIIAFIYPIFNEKIYFQNKLQEAESIAKQIAKVQNLNYATSNEYISIGKKDRDALFTKFNINTSDLKYYDYTIFTTYNSYTLYAEPKMRYLKKREISPKIYTYSKKLNEEANSKWE